MNDKTESYIKRIFQYSIALVASLVLLVQAENAWFDSFQAVHSISIPTLESIFQGETSDTADFHDLLLQISPAAIDIRNNQKEFYLYLEHLFDRQQRARDCAYLLPEYIKNPSAFLIRKQSTSSDSEDYPAIS